jgi:hypothetical protein
MFSRCSVTIQEFAMFKPVASAFTAAFTAFLIAAPSFAVAQTARPFQEARTEGKEMTEIRIDVVKNALQLSPEQTQYWPAVEAAILARAETRRQRLENVAARMDESRPDRDFVRSLQKRADDLSERGAGLRKLADAWAPLYPTLNDAQKRRMRILAAVVLHGVREDMEDRQDRREAEDLWGAAVGAGSGESGIGR